MARIPTTVVTGFLGTGKTTLIRHLPGNAGGRRLARASSLVVIGEKGIDQTAITPLIQAALADEVVADFMREPDALREAAERPLEAVERGLWRPTSNSAAVRLAHLAKIRETAA
jgi:predicted ATPase